MRGGSRVVRTPPREVPEAQANVCYVFCALAKNPSHLAILEDASVRWDAGGRRLADAVLQVAQWLGWIIHARRGCEAQPNRA